MDVLTTLECTIFRCEAETEDVVEFCCSDEASAAGSPMDLMDKEDRRLKAEENTVAVVCYYTVVLCWSRGSWVESRVLEERQREREGYKQK